MNGQTLRTRIVDHLLPRVQMPGQYLGSELGAVRKDHAPSRGTLCLAFPDRYTIGMSHHGLQVLYEVMNRREDWVCERVFAPGTDLEELLRQEALPLFSLESFTPIGRFDVLGFTLQYELCATNVLTILDLGRIPLAGAERTWDHPLVIAGGPCARNPEPMARFVDLFVLGDGEESLPRVCDRWRALKRAGLARDEVLARLATELHFVYAPRFYEPTTHQDRPALPRPTRDGLPGLIVPAVVEDLDAVPIPTAPIVPYVETVHDRIALEIMRGCPGRCRFCQSTTLKRPVRWRRVETIVEAAKQAYANTGYNEISLLSLSTSDYPHFEELVRRLQEHFRPLGVSLSVPSLRVNRQWRTLTELLNTDRRSGLTIAPEVALDEMRLQVGKPITNDDLLEGCRTAFQQGFRRVKLYFMCGLPGEREQDLDGVVELAETISRLGKETHGQLVKVVANVSNFVPKPHTPYQWWGMQTRDYFRWAHRHLWQRRRLRSVDLKCHDIETSLLEGVFTRGDRRLGEAIELAWRRGARFDAWRETLDAQRWWQAFEELDIDVDALVHQPYPADAPLPWDHVAIHQGRDYLEKQRDDAQRQIRSSELALTTAHNHNFQGEP